MSTHTDRVLFSLQIGQPQRTRRSSSQGREPLLRTIQSQPDCCSHKVFNRTASSHTAHAQHAPARPCSKDSARGNSSSCHPLHPSSQNQSAGPARLPLAPFVLVQPPKRTHPTVGICYAALGQCFRTQRPVAIVFQQLEIAEDQFSREDEVRCDLQLLHLAAGHGFGSRMCLQHSVANCKSRPRSVRTGNS